MESETDQPTPAEDLIMKEEDIGCEEVLLGPEVVANGDDACGDIDYLDENDPMADLPDVKSQVEATIEGDEFIVEDIDEDKDEVVGDGEGEDEDKDTLPMTRAPTQVPKKRKDPALYGATDKLKRNARGVGHFSDLDTGEKPAASVRSNTKEENSVDEEQCRVCTTKEDLVSLFKKIEQLTVAEMLMTICPVVSIAKKDFMPQYICNTCLDNVTIAVQLKTQCETTERELRKKLSRSKNKVRRPAGYVVVDAHPESDPPSEEEETNDDVEFKVSEASASLDDDSEDSDFSTKKKRTPRGAGSRRGRRKAAATTPAPKQKKRVGRAASKRAVQNLPSSDEEKEQLPLSKRKRTSGSEQDSAVKKNSYPCDECDQVFNRKLSLILHKKTHGSGREPINCEMCGKQFKIQGAYRTHLERHKETTLDHNCEKCPLAFATKVELKRHLADEHQEYDELHQCSKCKRIFASKSRMLRHREGRCPGFESKNKKTEFDGFAVGKELFKSVAPMTTTYWSDSFSD